MPRLKLIQALKRNLFIFWLLGLVPIAFLGSIMASVIAPELNGGSLWINPVALVPFALYFFIIPDPGVEKSCSS